MALIYTSQKSKRKPKNSAKKKALQLSWEALCRKYGIEPKKRRASTTFQLLTDNPLRKVLSLHSDRNPYRIQSAPSGSISSKVKVLKSPKSPKLRMTPEEAKRRESAARLEIERKKKRVAIAYNKGAYQYITDDADPKTFGRK